MTSDKLDRVVRARLRLKARYEAAQAETPSVSDTAPQGTGEPNRHGMPKLPVGQVATKKWPVLDLGKHPQVSTEQWELQVDGACAHPTTFSFAQLLELEQVQDVSDFHCVTTWSRMDVPWVGVRFSEVMAQVGPDEGAEWVMCHAYDGYTTNLPMVEAMKPDVLLVHRADHAPLSVEHGGPVRVITPQLYAWKGAKWIRRIELMTEDRLGFWEQRGYSNSAHPWRDDRYS